MDLYEVSTRNLLIELGRRLGAFQSNPSDLPLPSFICRPVVVSGPSGVGKGTLLDKLRRAYPKSFGFSVSHTTRPPRGQEQNGVDYNFTSTKDFEKQIGKGRFLEYANVHGNYYGTSVDAVDKIRNERRVPLLDIDVQGAKQVYDSKLVDAFYIFIMPPSLEELEKRLRGRGDTDAKDMTKRLSNAGKEMKLARTMHIYDAFLVNKELDETFHMFKSIIDQNRKMCDSFQQLLENEFFNEDMKGL